VEIKILEILQKIHPDYDYTNSDNFVEDGYLDSFDVVMIVSEIEEEFKIVIDGLDVLPENFVDIAAICKLVRDNGGLE